MTGKTMAQAVLDLVGLKCPLPVLRARKALASLAPGQVLEVSADDPLAALDIPHLLAATGDTLVTLSSNGGVTHFRIRKAG
jgi:tRNA 2-thiouridine synthesizing protein A